MAVLSNKFLSMYPRTPSGETSLLDLMTEPSHRIAGNMLAIGFEADPAVVRAYVPEPLELDGSGLVMLMTYDAWVFSERNSTEFVSPEGVNFTESFFWIPCAFEGERLHFMPFSWVNRDWLAYLGRQVGQPHKLAKVQVTRFHPSDPVYDGPRDGVRVCASVENVGLVHRTHVDLKRIYEPEELPVSLGSGPPAHATVATATSTTWSRTGPLSTTWSCIGAMTGRSARFGAVKPISLSMTPRMKRSSRSSHAG